MPSINDLMINVIEKEMLHIDEFKLTVIVSMFRMISKVRLYRIENDYSLINFFFLNIS